MPFSKINYYHFRNIQDQQLTFHSKNIIFIGKNAQGKTNLLESIYLLSFGSSFKSIKEKNFIHLNENSASLIAEVAYHHQTNKIQLNFQQEKISITIDKNPIKDRKELLNFFPLIIFKYEDIFLINGSPELKRNFIDQVISLSYLPYIDDLRRYKKILKQRNALLKNGKEACVSNKLLDILDEQLAEAGACLIQYRFSVIKEFNESFGRLFNQITESDNQLSLRYLPSWKKNALQEIRQNRERDFYYKTTTSGPHRDQYVILKDEFDFSKIASTGQKRVLALLLKLNQAFLITQKRNEKPVFLFDDVLLELDGIKKQKLLQYLPDYEQAFWTFLPEENYRQLQLTDLTVFKVNDGRVEAVPNEKD